MSAVPYELRKSFVQNSETTFGEPVKFPDVVTVISIVFLHILIFSVLRENTTVPNVSACFRFYSPV